MSATTQAVNTGASFGPSLARGKQRAISAGNKLILSVLAGLSMLGLTFLADVLEQVARSDPGEHPFMNEHPFGHRAQTMGAKRIGSLAIGIAVVGIVLNKMAGLGVVTNSSGVIDINSIFQTAGAGLSLLVVGVIIAAAAVILNIWSGF